MLRRSRPSKIGKCEGCNEKTKVWKLAHMWLCEYCLDLYLETL